MSFKNVSIRAPFETVVRVTGSFDPPQSANRDSTSPFPENDTVVSQRITPYWNRQLVQRILAFGLWACLLVGQVSLNADEPHLYFFTNDGCAPCRQVEPAIDALHEEGYPVTIIKASQSPRWVRQFQIDRTPTVIMTANKKIVGRHAGLIDAVTLKKWFASVGMASGSKFRDSSGEPIRSGTKVVLNETPRQSERLDLYSSDRSQDGKGSEDFRSATMHKGTTRPGTNAEARALAATVLLRVEDPEGISYATGTVIHSHANESLVMTCGHVFRESQGKGQISAEYGFHQNRVNKAQGELIFFDADARDIALVAIRTPEPITPVKIAAATSRINQGIDVFSIGCDHGEPPTIRRTRIKNKASYDGAIKYDIFGRPVDGRSGGGLFTTEGEFIGVCNAAVVDVDEGIYSSLETVYWQIETVNLRHLFDQTGPTTQLASQTPGNRNYNTVPTRRSDQDLRPINRIAAIPVSNEGNSNSVRTPVAWDKSNPTNKPAKPTISDHEVIIIVRSKSDPTRAEAITISDPSPRLLNYLNDMQAANPIQRKYEVVELRKNFR